MSGEVLVLPIRRTMQIPRETTTAPAAWWGPIVAWTTALRAIGRREPTIVLYRHYLTRCGADVGGSPWDVTTADLERVLGLMGGGPSARKSMRSAIRGFYRWAHATGKITEDPSAPLPGIKVPRGRPRPTPEGVLAGALAGADERVRLMLELGALAGLRAGEISRVHRTDFDGEKLLVHGKGGVERLVPIVDGHLKSALLAAPGWLFPNRQRGGHLTPNHVSKLVAAALPAPWTAHTLRHRFGTRAYRATRDLLAVSALLGHARPETTLVYVELPDDHLRAAVEAAGVIGGTGPLPAAA